MTAFAEAAFLTKADSDSMARAAFSHFFVPNGLPRLVIFDAGSEFAGVYLHVYRHSYPPLRGQPRKSQGYAM
jgi:hypothetical protein